MSDSLRLGAFFPLLNFFEKHFSAEIGGELSFVIDVREIVRLEAFAT